MYYKHLKKKKPETTIQWKKADVWVLYQAFVISRSYSSVTCMECDNEIEAHIQLKPTNYSRVRITIILNLISGDFSAFLYRHYFDRIH